MHQWTTHSPEETMSFSEQMAVYLQPGDVLTLSGDLGAGKTIFTKGLAKGLGIREMVNSPTFTIVKEYHSGRLPLYHMDVYRISDDEDIGLEDYFEQDGVTVVEWAENIPSWLPDDVLSVVIERVNDHERIITCTANGSRSERINEEISKHERTSH
ncbi:tRNA (adenosine(37)-N6)-threonylcarbamoyltransferase complex ATPase subunit type 1 TsaE [Sporolactobacillus laevolacticus]|uniref:tRNA (adenosine(37)-N6)-threonylcarbamoyltransferase complex ATPase subunit type 1 TsaE n=1 Tax=Sporolactobacillus laevolacticus TaxID=33018 RepID=UPI0025B411CD|nr:tRNA (adenosine(37)-N6)-threonylcarbamoyltransferase complex ATPase subunit type 1 TsaE [Sporolactobacillus laevolacticus]MDN3955795.1 tRNA (adenosine(37)-N6)-threonylcarbamoyltransferase complex ATPase subunit type 1 TsaE [Sporolactobacillus laevolacticus]